MKRITVERRLKWIPIAKMKVNPLAQRELNSGWVDTLVANFEIEKMGTPTLNLRDGFYWIVDGHHTTTALKKLGMGDLDIQCWTYEGLTSEEEAEVFLSLNNRRAIRAFDKFKIAVHAGRQEECEIDRVVRAQDLTVAKGKSGISAVGALTAVHRAGGSATLGRTLRIIRDAYGEGGFQSQVIEGVGLVCARYNGQLDEGQAVQKLAKAHGGVNGLITKAGMIQKTTGESRPRATAAAAVEIINSGRSGKKLPSWWKQA